MRRFLGVTGWYRRFIQNNAKTEAPLYKNQKKGRIKKYELDQAGMKALEALKSSMVSAPVLIKPTFVNSSQFNFGFHIEHIKGALSVVPVALLRTHMEEIATAGVAEVQIDL